MVFERLIRRTIWVSKCPKCGSQDEKTDNAPRSRLCKCGEWVNYVAESAIGPDLEKK
jgi:hypothetical protein